MRWLMMALVGVSTSVWSATAEDLLRAATAVVPADELTTGNPARATAIAAVLDTPGLAVGERALLRVALAEAWLDALDPVKAEAVVGEVLATSGLEATVCERAQLVWIAAWHLRTLAAPAAPAVPAVGAAPGVVNQPMDPVAGIVALAPAYPPTARVRVRALAARAQAALARKDASALADLDAALALLATADAGERVPLYALRLTAMEANGATPEEVRLFLQQHRDDAAATIAAEAALTAVQKLAGQPAPALRLKRLDGKPGELTLADVQGAKPGKPVLVDVFATWCKPCTLTAPAVTALAKRWQSKGVAVVGVSLDTKDTIAAVPAWIATYAIDYPIVGDGLGWDSEFAAAWHIDSIPRLILVDAYGNIVTADLGGATAAEVERNVDEAIQHLVQPPVSQPPVPAASPNLDVIP